MTQQVAQNPGWYPQADGTQRYWDGQQWTGHVAPGQIPPPPQVTAPLAAKKKNWFLRHKILSTLGVFILLGIVISAVNGGGGSSPAPAADSKAAAPGAPAANKAAEPGLNTAVRDGKFEFSVSAISCGKAEVGSGSLTKKAQGQFCIVGLTVKNIGNEAQYLDASSQKGLDASKREYSADGAAGIYLGDAENTFLNQINPGNSVVGKVVFDIPKDVKLTNLELHDSMLSEGVLVKVG